MSSRFLRACVVMIVLTCTLCLWASPPVRVCADPDNLPFSNRARQGFDNRIAMLVLHTLHRQGEFVWVRSRRGFLREEFNKGLCDLLIGAPVGMRGVTTTDPYYRSTYVFVTPSREHLQIARFDDPQLKGRRIGLQILEEDYAPPSLPLIREGYAAHLVGFDSFGKHAGDIVRAVAGGQIGTAVVWGPIAGFFKKKEQLPLTLTPVSPERDASGVPFAYSIGFAVHHGDLALRDALNRGLKESRSSIRAILGEYGVPLGMKEAR
ncbi:quinoprotein dehydrogenase-associated putative ABC transporter substrate-binding protein [Acidobacteria bacterium AB60]|nr:quinoprotein dehydrogenase-associated putative ABC transporter substrate-binding protein [Acidobacteria bacterium AB60]